MPTLASEPGRSPGDSSRFDTSRAVHSAVNCARVSMSTWRNSIMAIEWKGSSLALNVFLRRFLVVMFLTAFGGAALAQSSAALGGTVTDATGAVVPNAQVMVTNQATGVASATQTDTTGAYLFPALPIGIYLLYVRSYSFETAVIAHI